MVKAYHETKVPLDLVILFIIGCGCHTGAHVVHKRISEFIVHLFYHEVLGSLKSLLGGDRLKVPIELAVHFFKDAHALLVPIIHLRQQWKVISSVLIEYVVFDYDHLQLLHIKSSVHLNGALVNQVDDLRLLL